MEAENEGGWNKGGDVTFDEGARRKVPLGHKERGRGGGARVSYLFQEKKKVGFHKKKDTPFGRRSFIIDPQRGLPNQLLLVHGRKEGR